MDKSFKFRRATSAIPAAAMLAVALITSAPTWAQEPPVASPPPGATAVQALYVQIPDAGSPIANAMLGATIGSSNAVKQLEQVMALGEKATLTVTAFGSSERLTLKAAEAALRSFEGKRLPHLTLGVVANAEKVEKLRPLAESIGVQLVVGQPLK